MSGRRCCPAAERPCSPPTPQSMMASTMRRSRRSRSKTVGGKSYNTVARTAATSLRPAGRGTSSTFTRARCSRWPSTRISSKNSVPVAVAQNVATGTGGAAQLDFAPYGPLIYRFGGQQRSIADLHGWGRRACLSRSAQPDDYRFVRLSPDGQKIAPTLARTGGIDCWFTTGKWT